MIDREQLDNEFIERLMDDRPHFFGERICYFSYVPVQWQPIFVTMLNEIESLGAPYPTICQLKEKWGEPCFYFDYPPDFPHDKYLKIRDIIIDAETKCEKI